MKALETLAASSQLVRHSWSMHRSRLWLPLQWLEIKPTDNDKTKAKKKKLQKSYKSKLRFRKLDMQTKNRQQSWLDFRKGKGAKKKVCIRTQQQAFGGLPQDSSSQHLLA